MYMEDEKKARAYAWNEPVSALTDGKLNTNEVRPLSI
jgi:hypothetical protein